MADRIILHCDCNSFFASVETVLHPEYKNLPMAVCGKEENRHGIVLAKNEIAKSYGIKTAETVYSAKKKCPSLVIAEPHYEMYSEYSKKANEIYSRYTDMVEPFGIDESWLDVTASQRLFGSGPEIAKKISDDIKNELGITVSIGVSFNKVFAKLGSDYKKPDAITVIERKDVERIVYPLPVGDLLFVGRKTEDALLSMGIRTIGDLAGVSENILSLRFGKIGEMLYKYARGLDDSPVQPRTEEAKSISSGFTFKHDLTTLEQCKIGIDFLSDEIGRRLRKKGLKCSTVQITIKDGFLHSVQRQKPLSPPSDISEEISDVAFEILRAEWSVKTPLRMLTVSAHSLVKADVATQMSFLDGNKEVARQKKKEKENTIDKIKQKYGKTAIIKGAQIKTDLGIYQAPMEDED